MDLVKARVLRYATSTSLFRFTSQINWKTKLHFHTELAWVRSVLKARGTVNLKTCLAKQHRAGTYTVEFMTNISPRSVTLSLQIYIIRKYVIQL